MMMHPGSQCFVQFRSRAHILRAVVEFSVDVVYEKRFTCGQIEDDRRFALVFATSFKLNFLYFISREVDTRYLLEYITVILLIAL